MNFENINFESLLYERDGIKMDKIPKSELITAIRNKRHMYGHMKSAKERVEKELSEQGEETRVLRQLLLGAITQPITDEPTDSYEYRQARERVSLAELLGILIKEHHQALASK